MTHGKPCVIRHAKANACVTHGKPCVHMHANGHVYKMGGDQFVEEGRSRKERRRKKKKERKERKKERDKEKKGREIERKRNSRSDRRNSSDQVKSIYSTRATLQEVGILPTLVYFSP